MFGIFRALTRLPHWNVDKFRFTREQLPPVEYLTRPYFDQWYRCFAAILFGSELVTIKELAIGHGTPLSPLFEPMSADDVRIASKKSTRYDREYHGAPVFAVGDRVRACLNGQTGHTRLPQYVRGHFGVVVDFHGAHIVPDENARGRRVAEPLYTVAFELTGLFPEPVAVGDVVHLDLWERYLERSP